MIYNKVVLDCFFKPRHAGTLDVSHECVVVVKNSQQHQALIEFYLECSKERVIHQVRYKTNGNPYLIAALEWSCRRLGSVSLDERLPVDYQLLIRELNIPVAQYPLALRVMKVLEDGLMLMKNRLD